MKTITKIIFTALLLFVANFSFAQKKAKAPTSFSKHQLDINLGAGYNMTTIVNGMKAHFLPVSANIDYGITNNLSIGAGVGYSSVELFIPESKIRRAEATDNPELIQPKKQQFFTAGLRFAAHYNKWEKVDFYGGPIVGMRFSLVTPAAERNSIKSVFEANETERKAAFGAFVGARYHIVRNLGIFAELGALNAPFQLGVNLRL